MPNDLPPIEIDNPGVFILPDGEFPVARLDVHRNEYGQTQKLIILFDRTLRAKLQSNKSVLLKLRGSGDQIEVGTSGELCWDQDISTPGLRHLHVPVFDQNVIRKIDTLIQSDASRHNG